MPEDFPGRTNKYEGAGLAVDEARAYVIGSAAQALTSTISA